eukprot:6104338-Pyramimonas_sp.AAC.1
MPACRESDKRWRTIDFFVISRGLESAMRRIDRNEASTTSPRYAVSLELEGNPLEAKVQFCKGPSLSGRGAPWVPTPRLRRGPPAATSSTDPMWPLTTWTRLAFSFASSSRRNSRAPATLILWT